MTTLQLIVLGYVLFGMAFGWAISSVQKLPLVWSLLIGAAIGPPTFCAAFLKAVVRWGLK